MNVAKGLLVSVLCLSSGLLTAQSECAKPSKGDVFEPVESG